jgi:hypothetical protein
MLYLIIFIIILLLTIIIVFMCREQFTQHIHKYDGICAFDLDNTITCGLENAKIAIDICKKNNYKIAINTARPTMWFSDIKLDHIGLLESDFIDDFYFGDNYACSFTDYECLSKNIADTKTKHLHTLAKKYDINPSNVILFDDIFHNINNANNNGFSTIFANNPMCGLPNNIHIQLENIMSNK